MYGIDGRADLTEETLDHLEGYRGSRPVRIGNAAYRQLQLDIYGELMDAVYLHNKYVAPVAYDGWVRLRRLVDWLCDNWKREDEGIWEVRGGRQHFVYSKLMCWVALDRGLRLADKRSFPADRARWLKVRDEIYEEVMTRGWDPRRQAFVQAYGSDALDASSLLMPLVFFMAPNDPRMLSTLDAIRRPLAEGGLAADGLVYRYDPAVAPDGLPGREGTFNMCSFWLVEALTRAGRTDPRAAGRRAAALRADARLRQPPRPLRRADRQQRRGPGQLPAGVHPPGPDQRRLQPRPGARAAVSPRFTCKVSRPGPVEPSAQLHTDLLPLVEANLASQSDDDPFPFLSMCRLDHAAVRGHANSADLPSLGNLERQRLQSQRCPIGPRCV